MNNKVTELKAMAFDTINNINMLNDQLTRINMEIVREVNKYNPPVNLIPTTAPIEATPEATPPSASTNQEATPAS